MRRRTDCAAGLRVRRRPASPRRTSCPATASRSRPIVQTLIDLATELSSSGVERAVNEADKRDLIDPETLRWTRQLRRRAGAALSAIARQAHLPPLGLRPRDPLSPNRDGSRAPSPLTKQIVNGFEVDFFWPDLGLVVETDGLRYHRTPSTQARDARRDRAHTLAGMTPLRFTHYEIKHEPQGRS